MVDLKLQHLIDSVNVNITETFGVEINQEYRVYRVYMSVAINKTLESLMSDIIVIKILVWIGRHCSVSICFYILYCMYTELLGGSFKIICVRMVYNIQDGIT